MRLLVSVANATEAAAALAGGADVIDAKDPLNGALGAVALDTMRDIHATIAGARLVTAAIGDAKGEAAIERTAYAFAAAGATLVKVGFAGITSARRVEALIRAAVRGARAGYKIDLAGPPSRRRSASAWLAEAESAEAARGSIRLKPDPTDVVADPTGVVAVAYVDIDRAASLAGNALVEVAARAGARGVLLDTADKAGPGLRALRSATALSHWVSDGRAAGLLTALAGKLAADDLPFVRDAGADIVGVRGAACEGGRGGRVSSERVALLRRLCHPPEGGAHVRDLAEASRFR
jgi:(5-formylfuran-3-yl)methyl phosphate synthase